jgi:hypothetical protein
MALELEPCEFCGVPMAGTAARCGNCGKRRTSTGTDAVKFLITAFVIIAAAKWLYERRGMLAEIVAPLKAEAPVTELSVINNNPDVPDPATLGATLRNWFRGDFAGANRKNDRLGESYEEALNFARTQRSDNPLSTLLPTDILTVEFPESDDTTLEGLGRADRKLIPFRASASKNRSTQTFKGFVVLRTDIEPAVPWEIRITHVNASRGRRR